ncbi:MAG: M1 family peptidase, partial [Gemmatimonadaceae bacterium]
MRTPLLSLLAIPLALASVRAQAAVHPRPQQTLAPPTHADTLRGSITPERAWWDVTFYDLRTRISPADSTISGHVGITYAVLAPAREMQIDLQMPLLVDSVTQNGHALATRRDGNAFFVTLVDAQKIGDHNTVVVYYHGKPKVALRPPWDGGLTWTADSLGNPWVATTDQGLGASVWW